MQAFIDTFVMPVYNSSPILRDRKQIHASKDLNLLLAVNQKTLNLLYNETKKQTR